MAVEMVARTAGATLDFVWLEITGKCQLECRHCYAESGPHGSHGAMTKDDWLRVIGEAAAMGVGLVQFIGGEPTLHPDFGELVSHALDRGVGVEVYSNLVRAAPAMWELFERPGVRLATSWYSPDANEHEAITGRRRSHGLTLANIREAVRRGVPIRVGVIGVESGQHADGAVAEMRELGIVDVGVDHLRQVGRGVRAGFAGVDQLCGQCATGKLAVMPHGEVYPCVFSRWLPVGDARTMSLVDVDRHAEGTRAELAAAFSGRVSNSHVAPCIPDGNPPCKPMIHCGPACGPTPDGCRPRA